ncbi:MAG TPA: response regulator [Bryobacteraceae bacterium]|nr:response regulator [Bryobacteraceae bacterium]
MALSETILVVEDHSALLRLVKHILEDAHFTVLPASTAREASRLEAEYPGTIDLLLTDVRMRGTSGPTLAKRLQEKRPQMRVMLMSGYPGGALLVLDYGWHYIEKPFVPAALVTKIKDILRGETREHATFRSERSKVARRRPMGRVATAAGFRAPIISGAQGRG